MLGSRAVAAEASAANAAMSTITVEKVQNYVNVLADDSFEGRETGSRGGHGRILSGEQFQKLDLQVAGTGGGYYQLFGTGSATSSPLSKAVIPNSRKNM